MLKFKINRFRTGFTIVELLIVIVVIGILASLVISTYSGVQARARDTKRLTDLKAIAQAIKLYEIDNGHLPRESDGANGQVGEGAGLDAMIKKYMPTIPTNDPAPGMTAADSYYYYDGAHTCGGHPGSAILFAHIAEGTIDDGTPCTSYGGEGGSNDADAYRIRIGDSDG